MRVFAECYALRTILLLVPGCIFGNKFRWFLCTIKCSTTFAFGVAGVVVIGLIGNLFTKYVSIVPLGPDKVLGVVHRNLMEQLSLGGGNGANHESEHISFLFSSLYNWALGYWVAGVIICSADFFKNWY